MFCVVAGMLIWCYVWCQSASMPWCFVVGLRSCNLALLLCWCYGVIVVGHAAILLLYVSCWWCVFLCVGMLWCCCDAHLIFCCSALIVWRYYLSLRLCFSCCYGWLLFGLFIVMSMVCCLMFICVSVLPLCCSVMLCCRDPVVWCDVLIFWCYDLWTFVIVVCNSVHCTLCFPTVSLVGAYCVMAVVCCWLSCGSDVQCVSCYLLLCCRVCLVVWWLDVMMCCWACFSMFRVLPSCFLPLCFVAVLGVCYSPGLLELWLLPGFCVAFYVWPLCLVFCRFAVMDLAVQLFVYVALLSLLCLLPVCLSMLSSHAVCV